MKNTEQDVVSTPASETKSIDIMALKQMLPFLQEAQDLRGVNEISGKEKLSLLLEGLNLVNMNLRKARMSAAKAKIKRKELEGICRLEKFPDYAKAKGILKPSADLRDAFVDMDKEVQEAILEQEFYEAIATQLDNNKYALTMAISSTRAIAFGFRQADTFGNS